MKRIGLLFSLLIFLTIPTFNQSVHFVANNNDSGEGSLRQIIEDADSDDTIKFLPEITNVHLSSAELTIDKSLSIVSDSNIIVSRNSAIFFRIFNVNGDSIRLFFKNLKITNGNTSGGINGIHGGGILANNNASELILQNCILENNVAADGGEGGQGGSGGGIFGKYVELHNCTFIVNYCGNGGWANVGPPEPGGDGGSGGGLFCDSAIIYNSLFIQNETGKGGWGSSVGGFAGNGGGMLITTYAKIVNSTISLNVAQTGGGSMYGNGGKPGDGGGICGYSDNLYLDNCIISDNIAHYEGNDLYGTFYANYNLIFDDEHNDIIGDNNLIGLSPEFKDPPWDFSLMDISPAINSGNPDTSGLFLPNFDLSNNIRISGDTIDIGAYEYQLPIGIFQQSKSETFKIFPNPSTGKFWIKLNSNNQETVSIEIFNSFGEKIKQYKFSDLLNLIDLSNNPKGIYLVNIKFKLENFTQKIIIQ